MPIKRKPSSRLDALGNEVVKLAGQGIMSDVASLQVSKARLERENRYLKQENIELLSEYNRLRKKCLKMSH